MARKGQQFAGLTVAMVTPFTKSNDVDFAELDRLVDWFVAQGVECIAPVGTTGESPTLDHDEHRKVIAAVTRKASGRIKVMPGTGSNSTREAISLTKFAKEAGADGVVASPNEVALVREVCGPDFLIVTPGIRSAGAARGDQARTASPAAARAAGADYIVVGRPILEAADPAAAAAAIVRELSTA